MSLIETELNLDVNKEYNPRITPYLLFAALTAAIGPFFFGWNLSVLNILSEELKDIYNKSHHAHYGKYVDNALMISLETMSSAFYLCGGIIGSLLFGILARYMGRKRIMQVVAPVGFIGALLMLLTKPANALECMLIGRILFGIHSGVSMGTSPVYITEISATIFQGKTSAIPSIGITFGAFLSSLLGVKSILGRGDLLLVIFSIPLVVLVFQFICLMFCPETPKYKLLSEKDELAAVKILQKLRKCEDRSLLLPEIHALQEEKHMMDAGMLKFTEIFGKRFLKRTVIILVCNMAQQMCGVNGITFYSNSVFISAGLGDDEAAYGSVGVAAVLFVGSCLSALLLERLGRKPLMILGFLGMSALLIALVPALKFAESSKASAIFSILFTIVFMLKFSLGPGTIVWMITTELFPFEARPPAILFGVTVNWLSNLLVVSTFLFINNAIQSYSFLLFAIASLAAGLFTLFFVPETKNKTPQEVELIFNKEPSLSS